MISIPAGVHGMLKRASVAPSYREFSCAFYPPHWNLFVEDWAPRIHAFVEDALGPYGTQPRREIAPLADGFHAACANASFDLGSGQVCLGTHLVDQPGATLEKLCHEFIHGALSQFPNDLEGFYSEGYVDYSTWVLAHAPIWGELREATILAAADNIRNRRERALRTGNDYDRKRWSGGLFAMTAYGPYIISMLRQRKAEGNFTW
jgi:hypothetical protein